MKKHYRHESNCLNCGTTLEGKFCHNCGQENLEIKENIWHMMGHTVSDYFHFDHQFFKTLKPLLFKPGYLTSEYMAGRRVQYLHPVKMYIFISVVYFLLLFKSGHETVNVRPPGGKPVSTQKIIDSVNEQIAKDPELSSNAKKKIIFETHKYGNITVAAGKPDDGSFANIRGGAKTYKEYIDNQNKLPINERHGAFINSLVKKYFDYKEKYGARAGEVFTDEVRHNIPKMMFILLPLVALILRVTFWKNKKFYIEHLIYAFHLHCFFFLFLAIIMLLQMMLPESWGINGWLGFAAGLYMIWYVYQSLRVIYHRSVFRTITKIIGMSLIYFLAVSFCVTLIVVVTALTAS